MRYVMFEDVGEKRLGALAGGAVIDVEEALVAYMEWLDGDKGAEAAESLAPRDLLELIRLSGRTQRLIADAVTAQIEGGADGNGPQRSARYDLSNTRLLAPLSNPPKVICIGLNYADHAAESGMDVPKQPIFFTKFASSIIGPGEAVVHPGDDVTTQLDYEVELAFVIGRGGKDIPEEEALDRVFGYTVANDISARDLQMQDGQWVKGKTLDTFCPIGPAVVTADEAPDPHRLGLRLILNGEVVQDSNTDQLIFGIPKLIAYLSRLFTLEPGDLVLTGTPPGVGMGRKPPLWLKPGDVMVAEIDGIGRLENPVVGR